MDGRNVSYIVFFLLLSLPIYADSFFVDVPELNIKRGAETSIWMADYGSTIDIGSPMLPVKTVYYQLPEGATNVEVRLVYTKSERINNLDKIQEMKEPRAAMPDFVPKNIKREGHDKFPADTYRFEGVKHSDGRLLAAITLFPVTYFRNTKHAIYTNEYEFDISYDIDPTVEFSVQDIMETSTYGSIKYAIIAPSAYESALEPLAEWKTQKGIPARIYTTEDIYANYSGADNAEEIREFLIDLETAHDIDWVLLGGDIAAVPTRNAYVPDAYDGDGTAVPTDYYFADLEGGYSPYDWDYDNNGNYGEVADDIDWMPEAYVGRLSGSNAAQMETLVNRIIDYEKNPDSGTWTNRALLAGAESDAQTDEGLLMEFVRNDTMSSMETERLYYRDNYTREYVLTFANLESRISNGATLVNWAGHGSYYSAASTSTGPTFVSTATAPTNGLKRPFVYADSCNTGAYDQATCLGEDILRDWGMGFIGASRASWYVNGWSGPWMPMNQAHDYRFFEQLLSNNKFRPGEAFYDSKTDYISDFSASYHPDDSLYSRKNLLTYNLLGDPEMNIWTQEPEQLYITAPSQTAGGLVTVTVKDESSSVVSGAVVCISGAGFHETATTDVSGVAEINVDAESDLIITATKQNYIPDQSNLSISGIEITPISPSGIEYINPASVNFSFSVSSNLSIDSCRVIIESKNVASTTSINPNGSNTITWSNPFGGLLDFKIACLSGQKTFQSSSMQFKITRMTGFDGDSTDITSEDVENINDMVVERTDYGTINFTGTINLSGIDVNRIVSIGLRSITVDSESAPELNRSATLAMYNVSVHNPVVLRDGELCTDCTILSYIGEKIVFTVNHFSTYTVTGSSIDEFRTGRLTETVGGSGGSEGGNVTMVNLTSTISTDRWQGYYGNVSGHLSLGYNSYLFYDFGGGNGVAVYASRNSSFDFNNVEATTPLQVDTAWGYDRGNDQAEDIFTGTTNISGVVAPSVEINPAGQNFNSTILDDGSPSDKSNFAFGAVVQKSGLCFDGTVCDYELMVPSDGLETYYLFLEVG